jgi:hypothetical protein
MEVTEIILVKVSTLCQLSSHSSGFFQGYRFLTPYKFLFGGGSHGGHAHKTPSYDTQMIQKVVFEKTALVDFKISN